MDKKEILKKVDHTLLAQTATWEEIKAILDSPDFDPSEAIAQQIRLNTARPIKDSAYSPTNTQALVV